MKIAIHDLRSPVCLAVALAWLWSVESACATIYVYKPTQSYSPSAGERCFSNPKFLNVEPAAATSKCGANEDNGGLALYSGAWVGAANTIASHTVRFSVDTVSTVRATVVITYTGGVYNYGFASFSGTDWRWRVDDGGWHTEDLDYAFTVDVIVGKVVDLALLAAGGLVPAGRIAKMIDDIGDVWSYSQLALDMYDLYQSSQAVRLTNTFEFTGMCPFEEHELEVGLRASASAFLTGFSFALMKAQIESITLDIHTSPSEPADLIVGGIIFTNDVISRVPTTFFVERCNVGGKSTCKENYLLVVYDPLGGAVTVFPETNRFYTGEFLPDSTLTDAIPYTFTNKGRWEIFAWADMAEAVFEDNEINNLRSVYITVKGTRPDWPRRPSYSKISPPYLTGGLHRNHTYAVSTFSTDRDNDTLYYRFEWRAPGSTNWVALTNWLDSPTNGWSLSTNLYLTPVIDDPDLLPGTNINALTYFPIFTNWFGVRALAGDPDGESDPTREQAFSIVLNQTPSTPAITGDTNGSTLSGVALTAGSSDVNGDRIAFRFDWGETTNAVTWTDWYWCPTGQTSLTLSHVYTNAGTYFVNVEATDLYSAKYDPGKCSAAASYKVLIYTYRPGSNALVVTSMDAGLAARLPDAGFTVSGTSNYSATTGPNGYYETPAYPGSYTITFSNVPGYVTPSPQTLTLATNGHIEFCGSYSHAPGTIQVRCNTAGKGQIYGQGTATGTNFSFSGTNWICTSAWVGEYVIIYEPPADNGFSLPATRKETRTLTTNTPIEFCGLYIKRPVASLTVTYPTNNYIPSNSFVLLDEEGVSFDASGSSSPTQPSAGGGCPAPANLTVDSYWLHFGDGWWCWEATNYAGPGTWHALDGVFDGKNEHVFHRAGVAVPVTLTVGDSRGVTNRILVETNVWVKQRPVAQMNVVPSPAIAGEFVTFAGSGTDADGDVIVGYEWSSAAGTVSTASTFVANNLNPGTHAFNFRVRADDNVWSRPVTESLDVVRPKEWPAFKRDECRRSAQASYDDRTYGQLPYAVAWQHATDSMVEGSPVAADLDTNWANGLEIVFVSRKGRLDVTDCLGSNLWSAEIGWSSSTPAIGDLDGDGRPEIVVGSTNGVYVFSAGGTTNFIYTNTHGAFEYSMPIIADIDHGVPGREVAITADDGSVHLIYRDGSTTNSWPFTYPGVPFLPHPLHMFSSAPAVADIDPDYPGMEVVVGGADGTLYVLDNTGSNRCSYVLGTNAPIRTTPAVADLCPTNTGPEIVFGADNGVFYCLNYAYQSKSLNKVWEWVDVDIAPIRSSPAVAVLGGYEVNDASEIAFGCDGGYLHLLNGTNGNPVGWYDCGKAQGVKVRSTPAIADIDTIHNMPEVIFSATDGKVYVVNFAPAPTLLLMWTNQINPGPIFSSPAVADINHQPDLEILVGGLNYLYVFKATSNPAQIPLVDFTGSPLSGTRPLPVTFSDQSSSGPSNSPTWWRWDFGDGGTSPERNPTHAYDVPGYHAVSLTAGNAHGSNSLTKSYYVYINPVPEPDFAGSPLVGDAPLAVQFTDQSAYGPTSWSWNFGDGYGSSLQSPNHTYLAAGDFTVTLTAATAFGSDAVTKTNYVTAVTVCPDAAFTQDVTSGGEPLTVHFTDLSTHTPTAWTWNFGDGATSSQQHPVHTYQTVGQYLVSLTVSNAAGSDSIVSSSYVHVVPVVISELPPLLYLPFDEGSGTIAHDATTNHNDGTISGAAWTNGWSGSALYFHGTSSDGVVVPHSGSLDITNTFWVEAWIKAQGTANYLGIVDKYSGGSSSYGFTLYLNGGQVRLSIYSGAKGNCDLWAGVTDLRDNQWHHVAGGWDGSYARGYVDGAKLAEVPWTNAPGSTTQPLCIGKRYTGWGTYMPFLGTIDEVLVSRAPARPSNLSASRSGTNVLITWTGFGTLQSSTNVAGPYATATNAMSPYAVTPTASRMFYRLSSP